MGFHNVGGCLFFAVCISPLFLVGCTSLYTVDESVAQIPPGEFVSRDPRELVVDWVTIRTEPQNRKSFGLHGPLLPIIPFWSSHSEDSFWFKITLEPPKFKLGDIYFDPMQIVLETENGDPLVTRGFTGPFPAVFDRRKLTDSTILNASLSPFLISRGGVAVGVLFETKAIDPSKPFSLVLKGLRRGTQLIEVPKLKFQRQRIRHFDIDHINILFPHNSSGYHREWVVTE